MLDDLRWNRSADRFTLQWHLTHACDLRCKHCYDRSKIATLKLSEALHVLDELEAFCADRGVEPRLCLSGGNPLLYHSFFELYEEIARRGLRVSILGNPIPEEQLDRMVAIKKPGYFQVSLEGLREHNDEIRGEGFFDRVLEFLPLLRARRIQAVVMSTLSSGNIEELIPLSRLLRGRADRYAFNRLAQVGEGAQLAIPSKRSYGLFMSDWMLQRQTNTSLALKDNLFNIYHDALGMKLSGGCTGFGCGAAFNFLALLPGGELHACRKLPSPLGNLLVRPLGEIYDSPLAQRYRAGPRACEGCHIRRRCGGCMAVAYGQGLDPFEDRDPHCFMYD